MHCDRIIFRVHALKRTAERDISEEGIRRALTASEVIEEYPKDRPYPSLLIMGLSAYRPIHVLLPRESNVSAPIVITVYEPDTAKWTSDFRERGKK